MAPNMVATAAADADYVAIALACGWPAARDVDGDAEAFAQALAWADAQTGPILLRVKIGTDQLTTDFFLEDPVILARDFMQWLHADDGEAR